DLAPRRPGAEAGREVVQRLLTADDPDEISWHRSSLTALLADARRDRQAPRPDDTLPEPVGAPEPAPPPAPAPPPRPAGTSVAEREAEPVPHGGRGRPLLTRLRIRRGRDREAAALSRGGGADG
ncbi:DUF6397 family protein, partial [Streptomyces niveus]